MKRLCFGPKERPSLGSVAKRRIIGPKRGPGVLGNYGLSGLLGGTIRDWSGTCPNVASVLGDRMFYS